MASRAPFNSGSSFPRDFQHGLRRRYVFIPFPVHVFPFVYMLRIGHVVMFHDVPVISCLMGFVGVATADHSRLARHLVGVGIVSRVCFCGTLVGGSFFLGEWLRGCVISRAGYLAFSGIGSRSYLIFCGTHRLPLETGPFDNALPSRPWIQARLPTSTPKFKHKKSRKNNGHSGRSMLVKHRRSGMSKRTSSFLML